MDYKTAGVDIEAGYKSVELMKEHVKRTMREEVLGGLGGFSGAIIRPLSGKLSAVPLFVRGCIYTVGFFFVEFISGALLRCFHMCPWDYSNTPLNYRGLIRPDYAPLWFGAGLFFEKILGKLS